MCGLGADEGLGFGAEETADLGGEGLEGGLTTGEVGGGEGEAFAPDGIENGGDVRGREICGGKVFEVGEEGFGFGVVLVGGGAVGEEGLDVGGTDEFFERGEIGWRRPGVAHRGFLLGLRVAEMGSGEWSRGVAMRVPAGSCSGGRRGPR